MRGGRILFNVGVGWNASWLLLELEGRLLLLLQKNLSQKLGMDNTFLVRNGFQKPLQDAPRHKAEFSA